MGRAIAHRTETVSERGERALTLLRSLGNLDDIHKRIELVRQKDAGYRGAAAFDEPLNAHYQCGDPPQYAVMIATDGSQIYPDAHGTALYYLTNIGTFTYYHGSGDVPEGDSEPLLYYAESDLRERHGHGAVIKNSAVNARRSVQEMSALVRACWDHRTDEAHLIGIVDGRLLFWLGQEDIPHAKDLEAEYHRGLKNFYEEIHQWRMARHGFPASLVGYVERGDSTFVVRLLHLMRLHDEEISRALLETSGDFDGLDDDWLFGRFLPPQMRSAIMIQQSPQNRDYKKNLGSPYEVAFFYINVGALHHPHIIRIELPLWVAADKTAVAEIHSLVLAQCQMTGRYPYILTRAHELAVVTNFEKKQLETMINIELLNNQQNVGQSPKQIEKDLVGGKRKRYGQ